MKIHKMLVCLFVVLSGCGGGSGNVLPPPVPTANVAGVIFDAPIQNGVVTVYSFTGGKPGTVLGTGLTDPQGQYKISIQVESQPILIAVNSGHYIEEASGKIIELKNGQTLYAVQNFATSQPVSAAVSYYTTLATGYAEYLVRKGVAVSVAIDQANAQFSGLLAFDVLTTQPMDITDVANATPWVTAGHEYGFNAAAVSEWTLYAGRKNGVADHGPYNSIGFIQAAYDDIRTDGVLDGKGSKGELAMGIVPLTTRVYRHELALQILRIANSTVNHTNLTPAQLVDTANHLNDSTAVVFGTEPVVLLSEGGPAISNFSISNGAPVSGVITLSLQVTSVVPMATVVLVIDSGAPVSGNPAAPSFAIDTRTLPDGIHTLTILARDAAGVSSSSSIQVLVDNTLPQAFNRTAVVNGTLYGIYIEAGSGIADVWVLWGDGVSTKATVTPTSVTGGNWSVPVRYSLSWSLHATDRAGNSCAPTPADATNCQ